MLRKLLYHRGVDDASGTYVTGYCQFAVCFSLSFAMFVLIHMQSKKHAHSIQRSSYAVAGMLMSMAVIALFGAFTHQYLQEVGISIHADN